MSDAPDASAPFPGVVDPPTGQPPVPVRPGRAPVAPAPGILEAGAVPKVTSAPTPTTPAGPPAARVPAGGSPGSGQPAGEGDELDSMAVPMVDVDVNPEQVNASCPHCGAPVSSRESFCEACGGDLVPEQLSPLAATARRTPVDAAAASSADPHPGDEAEEVTRRRPAPQLASQGKPASRVCAECGGRVGDDLYCELCGTRAPSERDHFVETPASWVAGVCDRGIRHNRNEDAMALWAVPNSNSSGSSRAVLVVCDGVSTSTDSDIASLAASKAAMKVLVEWRSTSADLRGIVDENSGPTSSGAGSAGSGSSAVARSIAAAVAAANQAVVRTSRTPENPPSCTFACAVVEGDKITYGNIGDSRVYWFGDDGAATALSVDDSVAEVRISMGVPRDQAESSPQAHAITRWLGPDAPDLSPTTGVMTATGPGWLMVCSDGLWNYASEAERIAELMAELTGGPDGSGVQAARPFALADTLTQWANDQGGKDNITVALARVGVEMAPGDGSDASRDAGPTGSDPPPAPAQPPDAGPVAAGPAEAVEAQPANAGSAGAESAIAESAIAEPANTQKERNDG